MTERRTFIALLIAAVLVVGLAFTVAGGTTVDTNGNVITDITVDPWKYGAKINWNTKWRMKGWVRYGVDPEINKTSDRKGGFTNEHQVYIKNLEPDTTYRYRVVAQGTGGNKTVSLSFTFTTDPATPTPPPPTPEPTPEPTLPPTPEPTPVPTPEPTPVPTPEPTPVFEVTGVNIVEVGEDYATVEWNCSLPAHGWIEYGLDETYGLETGHHTSSMLDYHRQTIGNNPAGVNPPLEPETTYHFRAVCYIPPVDPASEPQVAYMTIN